MKSLRTELLTFCKAQLTAQVASLVDFLLTIFLTEFCGVWYAYSTFFGALTGGIVNCVVNYRWVFHADSVKMKHVAVKYFIVWSGSILLNTWGTYFLTEFTNWHYVLTKLIVAVAVGFLWNYQLQRFFVYKNIRIFSSFKKNKSL